MLNRVSFAGQPMQQQQRQSRAESANANRRSTVFPQQFHPQTSVRGDVVRQSTWYQGNRGKDRTDAQAQLQSMQTDIIRFLQSRDKVLRNTQLTSINDFVECFLYMQEIWPFKLINQTNLATMQTFGTNQAQATNQQMKQNVATIRSNVIQLVGVLWYILLNPPYDDLSQQLKTVAHSVAVKKAVNPFEKGVDLGKNNVTIEQPLIQALQELVTKKTLSAKLSVSLTRDTWRLMLLVQYLEHVKKAYHSFTTEKIKVKQRGHPSNSLVLDLDEIMSDLTPEQKKALQDVEGLYPISHGADSKADATERTVELGARDDGTFDDEAVKGMIEHAFQVFTEKNVITTAPYSGMIMALYTRASPCEASDTLTSFQTKVDECRAMFEHRLSIIADEYAELRGQLQNTLEVFCNNITELLTFISRNFVADSNLNTQIFNLLKKAKIVTTEDTIRVEKTDPARRDQAIMEIFHRIRVTAQYFELVEQSIAARAHDFYGLYNTCTDIIDVFFGLLTQKTETLEGTLKLLNDQDQKGSLKQKLGSLSEQKEVIQGRIDAAKDDIDKLKDERAAKADQYVNHRVYEMNFSQLKSIKEANEEKSEQIIELQHKILEAKKVLSASANGLATELSGLQMQIGGFPALARFMETSGVYDVEKIQKFEQAFIAFSDEFTTFSEGGIGDITLPLDRSGTTNAIEQMCNTLGPTRDGEPRSFRETCTSLKVMGDKLLHLCGRAQEEMGRNKKKVTEEEYSLQKQIAELEAENAKWANQHGLARQRHNNFVFDQNSKQEAKNKEAMAVLLEIRDLSKNKQDLVSQIHALDQEMEDLKRKREAAIRETEATQAACNERIRGTVLSCNNLLAMVESFRIRTTDTLSHMTSSLHQTKESVEEADLRVQSILDLVKEIRDLAAGATERHRK